MTVPNFSWLIEGVLCASGFPREKAHFEFYQQEGVTHIINLTEKELPESLIPSGLNVINIPIVDFTPPSIEQMNHFIEIVEDKKQKGEKVVCHCQWGRGRTGTMLAVYLIKTQRMKPQEAIDYVRQMRPHSIETSGQEEAIFKFAELNQTNPS